MIRWVFWRTWVAIWQHPHTILSWFSKLIKKEERESKWRKRGKELPSYKIERKARLFAKMSLDTGFPKKKII